MTRASARRQAWSPFHRQCLNLVFGSPFYRLALPRSGPQGLAVATPDAWPGNADRGLAIIEGRFTFAGTRVHAAGSPFDEAVTDPMWRCALHGFGWLRDLRALGGDRARKRARDLTSDWLQRYGDWTEEIWRADVTGRRLVAWIAHYELLYANAPDRLRLDLLESLKRQATHLGRTAGREVDGLARIAAIKGLLVAGICLRDENRLAMRALQLLELELPRQIDEDGGHVERGAAQQLALLRDLIDMRAALSVGDLSGPAVLGETIRKSAMMLKLLRHGDGGLAGFNGGGDDPAPVSFVLDQVNARTATPASAPQSGFERLSAGKLLVIADTGAPARPGFDTGAHAGTLSFEASYGRDRLIVNCGASLAAGPEWRAAARATAAHSTLALEDTNSSELLEDGAIGRRPADIAVSREESQGNIWLSLSHDGYAQGFGFVHRRRLYVDARGSEIRGEDSLHAAPNGDAAAKGGDHAYAIRFHVHPLVRVSMAQDGATVFLRLRNGVGWRMRVGGARIDLAESVYFGGEQARRTQQIVLSGRTNSIPTTVKWALRREGS